MSYSRRSVVALIACSLTAVTVGPALAGGTTVQVSLWDKGGASMSMMGSTKPMGMGMMGADIGMVTMGINADVTEVPVGEVTFQVVNDSKDMIHEMVLTPIADAATLMPYDADLQRVDEDAAGDLGEVADLDTGQSGALTLTLTPGTYILYCNIPGHYAAGMWTLLTVTA